MGSAVGPCGVGCMRDRGGEIAGSRLFKASERLGSVLDICTSEGLGTGKTEVLTLSVAPDLRSPPDESDIGKQLLSNGMDC